MLRCAVAITLVFEVRMDYLFTSSVCLRGSRASRNILAEVLQYIDIWYVVYSMLWLFMQCSLVVYLCWNFYTTDI